VNVSAPSISAAITQLEQEFGLPLVVRHHAQGLSRTLTGRQVMEQARVVLRAADALTDLAGDIAGTVRGPLSIGCLLSFVQVVLLALRRGFGTGFRDVALTYDLDLPRDLRFVPITELPPAVIVAETHPLAHLPSVTVEALADHPMVLLDLPLSSEYFLSSATCRTMTRPICWRASGWLPIPSRTAIARNGTARGSRSNR